MIGYEKPIIYLGGEYIGYRVKDNEKLAPDDNELCPVTQRYLKMRFWETHKLRQNL